MPLGGAFLYCTDRAPSVKSAVTAFRFSLSMAWSLVLLYLPPPPNLGPRCAQDARLLGVFGNKGKPVEKPFQIGAAAAAADSASISASGSSSSGSRRRVRGSVSLPPQPRSNRRSSTGSGGDGFHSQEEDEGLESKMRVPSDAGNAAKGGDRGESFLEAFGISSWTPPWSTTKVAVQQPSTNSRPERGPADSQALALDNAKRPPRHKEQTREGKRQEEGAGRSQQRESARAAAAEAGADAQGVKERGRGRERGEGEPDRKAPQLCVLDARTAVAALGNQLVGKGIETGAG